jgi:hypothetical protein
VPFLYFKEFGVLAIVIFMAYSILIHGDYFKSPLETNEVAFDQAINEGN